MTSPKDQSASASLCLYCGKSYAGSFAFLRRQIKRRSMSNTTPEQAAAEAAADKCVASLDWYALDQKYRPLAWNQFVLGHTAGVAWARERDEKIGVLGPILIARQANRIRAADERIAELEAENVILKANAMNISAHALELSDQLADLTGGLAPEEFKRAFLEMQKTIAVLSDE
jgi:hypothetical protein